MKHEKISYPEALRWLARKYGIEIHETAMTDEQRQARNDRESMYILNDFARKTFSQYLWESEEGRAVGLAYFYERGFRDDIIKKFSLGFSPDTKDAFTQKALTAGYKQEYLDKSGLTYVGENNYRADRFRGRVMFPIQSISGKIAGFGGRILLNAKTDKLAKYVNSPDSEVYHKENELYGIYLGRQAISKADKCFLVEGYTDVISLHQAGIENVVAPCGTALTENQIRLIRRLTANITLLNDGDAAGQKATMKDIPLLLEAGMTVRIVVLPEGEDPDSFARRNNAAAVADYIRQNEVNFVTFKADRLMKEAGRDPSRIAQSIAEIVDTIALIGEEITRLAFVKECSRITGYDEDTLVRRIAKKRGEMRSARKKDLYPEAANPDDVPPPPSDEMPPPQNVSEFDIEKEKLSNSALDGYERNIVKYIVRHGEHPINIIDENGDPIKITVVGYVWEVLSGDGLTFANQQYQTILEDARDRADNAGFAAEKYFLNHPNPEISMLAVDLTTDPYIESRIHSKYKTSSAQTAGENVEMLPDGLTYEMLNSRKAALALERRKHQAAAEKAAAGGDDARLQELNAAVAKTDAMAQAVENMLTERLSERIPYEVMNFQKAVLDIERRRLKDEIAEANAKSDSVRLITLLQNLQEMNNIERDIGKRLRERIIC
jgi:DNA primase